MIHPIVLACPRSILARIKYVLNLILHFRFIILALCLLPSILPARESSEFVIGPTHVSIASPEGLVDIIPSSPEMRNIGEQFTPPGNRLLAWYVTPEDAAALLSGGSPQMTEYAALQTLKETEWTGFSSKEFAKLKILIKDGWSEVVKDAETQIDSLTRKGIDNVSKGYDVEMDFQMGDALSLGIFYESEHAVCTGNIRKVESMVDGTVETSVLIYTVGIIHYKSKIIYAGVFKTYSEANDIKAAKERCRSWTEYIISQ